VARFRGDRPRELGDLAAKKNITSIFKDLPLLRTGGLTIQPPGAKMAAVAAIELTCRLTLWTDLDWTIDLSEITDSSYLRVRTVPVYQADLCFPGILEVLADPRDLGCCMFLRETHIIHTYTLYESQKIPPKVVWHFFTKRFGNFCPNFTRLLYVPIYARLQFIYLLICDFDEVMLCHIKREHGPVHIMCKMSTIGRNARWHFLTFFQNSWEF